MKFTITANTGTSMTAVESFHVDNAAVKWINEKYSLDIQGGGSATGYAVRASDVLHTLLSDVVGGLIEPTHDHLSHVHQLAVLVGGLIKHHATIVEVTDDGE